MYSLKSVLLGTAVVAVGLAGVVSICRGQARPDSLFSTREKVGQVGTNRYYTPANQVITPAGIQVELPGMRPQAIALSPNGRLLVTAGKTHDLVVMDPATGKIAATRRFAVRTRIQMSRPIPFPRKSFTRTRQASSVSPA